MGLINTSDKSQKYATIVDGSIRIQVSEGFEGAVRRDYETKAGLKGTKWELAYEALEGKIERVIIKDAEWGKMLEVTIDGVILSMNTETNYAQDIMKKLPNVSVNDVVKFKPYAFENDNGKKIKGMTIYQNGGKINSYFHKLDGDKKVSVNGYPEPEGDKSKYDSDDWKIYFVRVRKFLVNNTEEWIKKNIPELEQEVSIDDIKF